MVLEVGPGLGSLTLALLEAGAGQLVAIEIDRALAGELPLTIASHAPRSRGPGGRGHRGRAAGRRA